MMGNGSIVPEAEARRIVAYAFAYGFLPPLLIQPS
jgi:hypothetical protein